MRTERSSVTARSSSDSISRAAPHFSSASSRSPTRPETCVRSPPRWSIRRSRSSASAWIVSAPVNRSSRHPAPTASSSKFPDSIPRSSTKPANNSGRWRNWSFASFTPTAIKSSPKSKPDSPSSRPATPSRRWRRSAKRKRPSASCSSKRSPIFWGNTSPVPAPALATKATK